MEIMKLPSATLVAVFMATSFAVLSDRTPVEKRCSGAMSAANHAGEFVPLWLDPTAPCDDPGVYCCYGYYYEPDHVKTCTIVAVWSAQSQRAWQPSILHPEHYLVSLQEEIEPPLQSIRNASTIIIVRIVNVHSKRLGRSPMHAQEGKR